MVDTGCACVGHTKLTPYTNLGIEFVFNTQHERVKQFIDEVFNIKLNDHLLEKCYYKLDEAHNIGDFIKFKL